MDKEFANEVDELLMLFKDEAKILLINQLDENTIYRIENEGGDYFESLYFHYDITLNCFNGNLSSVVEVNWEQKYWSLPLSIATNIDAFVRLIVLKRVISGQFIDVLYDSEDFWEMQHDEQSLMLVFPLAKNNYENLLGAYEYILEILTWIDTELEKLHFKVASITENFIKSSYTLLDSNYDKLIERFNSNLTHNEKGMVLEEIASKLFSRIHGFKILRRYRTSTEEID